MLVVVVVVFKRNQWCFARFNSPDKLRRNGLHRSPLVFRIHIQRCLFFFFFLRVSNVKHNGLIKKKKKTKRTSLFRSFLSFSLSLFEYTCLL